MREGGVREGGVKMKRVTETQGGSEGGREGGVKMKRMTETHDNCAQLTFDW